MYSVGNFNTGLNLNSGKKCIYLIINNMSECYALRQNVSVSLIYFVICVFSYKKFYVKPKRYFLNVDISQFGPEIWNNYSNKLLDIFLLCDIIALYLKRNWQAFQSSAYFCWLQLMQWKHSSINNILDFSVKYCVALFVSFKSAHFQ
jgi:hypothetical protein